MVCWHWSYRTTRVNLLPHSQFTVIWYCDYIGYCDYFPLSRGGSQNQINAVLHYPHYPHCSIKGRVVLTSLHLPIWLQPKRRRVFNKLHYPHYPHCSIKDRVLLTKVFICQIGYYLRGDEIYFTYQATLLLYLICAQKLQLGPDLILSPKCTFAHSFQSH